MTRKTFTLADSFDETDRRLALDRDAPLPLGYTAAVQRGLDLRAKGSYWSWAVIASVMAEYHGIRRSASWWQLQLRLAGAPPRPRGGAFTSQHTRAAA